MDNEKLLQAISDMMDKKLDERLKPINDRLDRIESGQTGITRELIKIDRKISDTYNLALDAWGQSAENKTWLEGEKLKV